MIYGASNKYINSLDPETKNVKEYDPQKYTEEMIKSALEKGLSTGDYSDYRSLYEMILEDNDTYWMTIPQDAETFANSAVKDYKTEYAEAYESGDSARMEQLKTLFTEAGYNEDDISMIVPNIKREGLKSDALNGDFSGMEEYAAALKEAGKDDESIWRSVQDLYKPIYQSYWLDGNTKKAKEIEQDLKALGLKTTKKKDPYATDEKFSGWREDAEKEG